MRVDSHQHYWNISRGDYGWITPDIPVLYRDFLPADLQPELAEHLIDGTVLVQAAPTYEETDYLLSLAEEEPSVLGVVGWLDLADPEHKRHYERHRAHPKYKGFRIMIQDMPDARAILEPEYIRSLQYFEESQVPVDILVKHSQLEPLVELLTHVPRLKGVIDHIAKPDIRNGIHEDWIRHMSDIAKNPGLYCKISGMVTEAEPGNWKYTDFISFVKCVTAVFGFDRMMFGSDWPVCLMAASYREVVEVVNRSLPEELTTSQKKKIFGENAIRFYNI